MSRINEIKKSPKHSDTPEIFERIREAYPELSKQHRIIADAILRNGMDFAFCKAKELADKLGVSSSTVVRFATRLGYEGYPELLTDLRQIFYKERAPFKKLRDSFDNSLSVSAIYDNVRTLDIENINRARIRDEDIRQVVDMMVGASKVCIIAGRATFSLAYYVGFLLRQIDNRFNFFNSSSDYGYEQVSSLGQKDLLISLTINGYYSRTYDLTKFAHDNKIPVVAITDYPTSPLVPFSNISFFIPNEAPFCSYTAVMPLLNTLIVGFAKETCDTHKESFEKSLQDLVKNEIYYVKTN